MQSIFHQEAITTVLCLKSFITSSRVLRIGNILEQLMQAFLYLNTNFILLMFSKWTPNIILFRSMTTQQHLQYTGSLKIMNLCQCGAMQYKKILSDLFKSERIFHINLACPSIALSIRCGSMPIYLCVVDAELCCKSLWTRAMSQPLLL